MSNYNSSHTGAQIDEAVGRVLDGGSIKVQTDTNTADITSLKTKVNTNTSEINTTTQKAETALNLAEELSEEGRYIIDGNVTNNPDEVTLTSEDDKLQLKNRRYLASVGGVQGQMGYIILAKGQTFKQQVEAIAEGKTIFEIRYDYDLGGGSVTIPDGCTLKFDGGSVKNGSVVGSDTEIVAGQDKIFGLDVTLSGTWNVNTIYSKWWDLSTVANANVGLQKIFDFAYLSKGADIVFCSGVITFSDTVTIKTYTVQSGYRGWGLVIRGRNNFDATLNYTGSSHAFIFTEAGTADKFTDVEFRNVRIVAANATDILYASKGSNLRIYNCSFSSPSGICVNITDLWYWRVEQSTFDGTTCIKTTKGTSGYISNVVVNGVDYGINISGAYVRIDNIFSDICTGILCYFNACRVNISTIATESTALTTIISGINSHVEIGDAFFFKPASASASIFDGSGTTISAQNICIKDQGNKTTARCYLLAGSYANTLVRIARLEIDSKLLPQPYNDTNAANRGVHISRIVDSATKDGEYREWATIINDKNTTDDYSSLPKYNNARLIVGLQEPLKIATNIYDEQGNITGHGTSTQANMGKINDIYFNTYPAGGFPYFAWSRVSQTGTALNAGTNKFVQFLDTIDSVANAPTNVKVGHCIFCTGLGKPIWAKVVSGGSVTWVDATGTVVS